MDRCFNLWKLECCKQYSIQKQIRPTRAGAIFRRSFCLLSWQESKKWYNAVLPEPLWLDPRNRARRLSQFRPSRVIRRVRFLWIQWRKERNLVHFLILCSLPCDFQCWFSGIMLVTNRSIPGTQWRCVLLQLSWKNHLIGHAVQERYQKVWTSALDHKLKSWYQQRRAIALNRWVLWHL